MAPEIVNALPDLETFHHILAPEQTFAQLTQTHQAHPSVEAAYIRPASCLPIIDIRYFERCPTLSSAISKTYA